MSAATVISLRFGSATTGSTAVPGPVIIDDTRVARNLALGGAALIYGPEPCLAEDIDRGALRLALEDWSSMSPAMHVYYSSRRQVPAGLRLLIETIRELRPLGL